MDFGYNVVFHLQNRTSHFFLVSIHDYFFVNPFESVNDLRRSEGGIKFELHSSHIAVSNDVW